MKITYKNRRLKKILENERLIKKHYSKLCNKILIRMTELEAVRDLSLISHEPPPRKHRLKGQYLSCYAVDLSGNWRLVFRPIDAQLGNSENKITEIIIVEIIDYH